MATTQSTDKSASPPTEVVTKTAHTIYGELYHYRECVSCGAQWTTDTPGTHSCP